MGKSVGTKKSTASVSQSISSDISQKLFMGTMLSMSWQMAIVVLVPTVGGYKLDAKFNTSPYLTLTGLFLAMLGMVFIVKRAVKELNEYMMQAANKETDTK